MAEMIPLNLCQTSRDIVNHHRSLIEALCDLKNNGSSPNFEPDEKFEWTWDNAVENDFVVLLNKNRDVKFHRNISCGTAVVRGTEPMSSDQYFWEVKMMSAVYGTDMMVGVGTAEADVCQVYDKYISLLGIDNKTWGLSYTGLFHHNGESRDYSTRFGKASVIGIHLDMWNGTLSFYKNKKYLGIATRGLKGKTMYAMASSTAACSEMRIVRSCSFPSSLQFLCCAKLRELIPDEKNVLEEIKFPPGLHAFLENNLGWLLSSRFVQTIVQPFNSTPPSPKRRKYWPFDLDSDSRMSLRDHEENDAENSDSTPSNSERKFVIVPHSFSTPVALVSISVHESAGRQRRHSEPQQDRPIVGNCDVELDRNTVERDCDEELNDVLEDLDRNTVDCDVELNGVLEDPVNSVKSEAKRRRCSYNYAMGLSDPDSD